jgi:hypothetical protein
MRRRWVVAIVLSTTGCSDDGAAGQDTDTDASASGASGVSAPEAGPGSMTGDPSGSSDPTPGTSDATSDPTDDGASEGTTGGPLPPAGSCDPLPPPEGETIPLAPGGNLADAVANAPTGSTIVLADGTYDLAGSDYIVFRTPGVALRSDSGDPEAVILDGGYGGGSILNVAADDITIAELTVQRATWHPIHVTGGTDSNTENTTIYRVHVIDPGQQAIKINASTEGFYADNGVVACSTVVMTANGRANVSACYTGGVDAHLALGWRVHDNYFEGFWCDEGLSEHAIHFWNSGRDTVVERNVIVDCARGIGFGLGETGNGTARDYGDDPCPGAAFLGHIDGVIRNNTVLGADPALFATQSGFDSGISLEQACGTEVMHNTVVALEQPFTGIEYRWSSTNVTIHNNLVTHAIMLRDGAQADLQGNISDIADTSHFIDAAGNDLHLVAGSSAIDAGVPTSVTEDIDGDPRDASPDVGADEWVQ